MVLATLVKGLFVTHGLRIKALHPSELRKGIILKNDLLSLEKTSSHWTEVRSYLFLLSMLLNFAIWKTNSRHRNNPQEFRTLGYILSGPQCACHGMGSHKVCGTGHFQRKAKARRSASQCNQRWLAGIWWPWAEKRIRPSSPISDHSGCASQVLPSSLCDIRSQLLYLLNVVQSEIMFKEDNNFPAMIRNKSLISEAREHCGRGHIDNLT